MTVILTVVVGVLCLMSMNIGHARIPSTTSAAAAMQSAQAPAPSVSQGSTQPSQSQPIPVNPQTDPLWPKFRDPLFDPVTWFTFFLVLVSYFQLRAMHRQLQHMEESLSDTRDSIREATRSAGAMERIAEAMSTNVEQLRDTLAINKRMAETQEKALRLMHQQWLDVGNWTSKATEFMTDGQPPETGIATAFTITNSSSLPVTLTSVTFRFMNARYGPLVSNIRAALAPGKAWLHSGPVYLLESDHDRAMYAESRLSLAITVSIEFIDAFEENRKQDFQHVAVFGPNSQRDVEVPTLLHPGYDDPPPPSE
jgi:hypothetical protein